MIVYMRLSFAIFLIVTLLLFNNIHTTYSSINISTLQHDIATTPNSTTVPTTLKSKIMSSLWYRPYYNNELWTGVDDICSGRLSLHRHQLAPITVFSLHSHRHIDPMNTQSQPQDDSNEQQHQQHNDQQQQSNKYSQKEIDVISNAYKKYWNPGPVIPPHLYTPRDSHNNNTPTTNQQQNQHHVESMSTNHSDNQPTNWKFDGSTWVFDEPPSNPVMDVINNNDNNQNNQPQQSQQNEFEIQHRSRHNDPKSPVRVFQPLILGQIEPEVLEPDETVPNVGAAIPFKHKKRLFSTQAMINNDNDNYLFTLQSAIEKNNNNISPIHQIKKSLHRRRHRNRHEPIIIPLITDENRPSSFPSPHQNNHFTSLSHENDPNSQCLSVNTHCRITYSTQPTLNQSNDTENYKPSQNYRYLCHQTISNNCTYTNDDLNDRIIRIHDPPDNRSVQIEGYLSTQPEIHSIKKTDNKVKPNIN